MKEPIVVSIHAGFEKLTFVPDRTPGSSEIAAAFGTLAPYRDGAVYIAHYAGTSEWEQHPQGDELVVVLEGETTLFLLIDGEECAREMAAGDLIVVPRGIWHRFETPDGVKLMSVTPQPSEHSIEMP